MLSVSGGGAFEPHYFILMLPALALANGAWVASGRRIPGIAALVMLFFAGACLYSVIQQRDYLFEMTPYQFSRSTYGLNPFPEAVKVAEYIRNHSDPGARIAVLGSEAEIYFYSHREAATGYMFTYGLMETHRYAEAQQGEMMSQIMSARPEYIVFVNVLTSWLPRPGSSRAIFHWLTDYTAEYYDTVGLVDLIQDQPARYVWGAEAAAYGAATSHLYLTIYRRR